MKSSLERQAPVDQVALSRRRFLGLGIGAIAGLIGTALGVPLAGYAVSPALQAKKQDWAEIGQLSEFKPGQPKKVEYSTLNKDGWIEETVKKSAWILVDAGGTITAFDPRCTHLGCAYRWDEDRKRFTCPCHDGNFDIDGKVISGPPPRPLDRLQTKVEGTKLMVKEA